MPKDLPDGLAGDRLPEREGLKSFRSEAGPLAAPPAPAGRPLHELTSDTFFFNHGLMFSAGMLDEEREDPIVDYWTRASLPDEARPALYTAPYDLFPGMPASIGPVNWARSLLLVRKPYAQGVYDYLRAFSAVDWRRRLFWHAVVGSGAIDDPSSPASGKRIPVVLVEVSRGDASFEFRKSPLGLTPVRCPPKAHAAAMARAIFDESHTPFRAVEPTSHGDIPRVEIPDI